MDWSKRRHMPEMSPMSSSSMPARYGYQSARAGSHRWTCASTTRSIVMLRSSHPALHDAAQRVVDPWGELRSTERDGCLGVRVAAQPDPLRADDELGARQRTRVVGSDEVRNQLADGRRLRRRTGFHPDRERVD